MPASSVKLIATTADLSIALCRDVTAETIDELANLQGARLAVYSPRPDTVLELLEARGKSVNSYSLADALMRGQGGAT